VCAIGQGLPDNGFWDSTSAVCVAKQWASATEANDVESLLALAHPQLAARGASQGLVVGRAEVLQQRPTAVAPYRPLKDWVVCTDDPGYLVQELAPFYGGQVRATTTTNC
jgi:hypothetical protein